MKKDLEKTKSFKNSASLNSTHETSGQEQQKCIRSHDRQTNQNIFVHLINIKKISVTCLTPKKNTPHFRTRCFQFYFGGTSGGRTHDKRIKSPLLYQLSYGPITQRI
jgi:hypothetical protein